MRGGSRGRLGVSAPLLLLLLGACGGAAGQEASLVEVASPGTTVAAPAPSSTTSVPVPSTRAPTTTAAPRSAAAPVAAAAPAPRPRTVHEQAWTPFAAAGGVVLRHPSSRVERVGFHQSGHDGARQLEPLPGAADPVTLEDRGRDTGSRTAADVVVDPSAEIRAPVTGRVIDAGTYVLYCDNSDDYAIIEPDDHLGWQVKVFHISGVQVRAGSRVQAGQTVLAPAATRLPFESQIDEVTARPAWPHVHVEIVDPSIPDRPSGGGC